MARTQLVQVRIVHDDAMHYGADLLVLKFARKLHGLDDAVFKRLRPDQQAYRLPPVGEALTHETIGILGARYVMYVGVPSLNELNYAGLREFGRKACEAAQHANFHLADLALTVNGPNFGLDETEAFESVLAGIMDAVEAGTFPKQVKTITFVERDLKRWERLAAALNRLVPEGAIDIGNVAPIATLSHTTRAALHSAGSSTVAKPRVFVAMPFISDMDDVYHYGIQGAVHAAEMLCERADLSVFTGDVMTWVRQRIEGARLLIADLSGANPNVYLEVGYAWGQGVPTVLLCKKADELKFDVRGQRCICYTSIKDLETKLGNELKGLLASAPLHK
jgi:hypothetical protein